jgi:hypothetical protein
VKATEIRSLVDTQMLYLSLIPKMEDINSTELHGATYVKPVSCLLFSLISDAIFSIYHNMILLKTENLQIFY